MTPAQDAGPLVHHGMLALVILVGVLWILALLRAGGTRWAALGAVALALWMGLTGAVAGSGVLRNTQVRPPPFVVMLLALVALALAVSLSPVGARLSRAFPVWMLVAVQGFRFPLELVMHQAAAEKVMPQALTWTGYNLDIVTGVTACVLAALLWKGRVGHSVVRLWNGWGFLELFIIAVIAMLTSPLLQALGEDQVNWWVTYVPYVWLPTVLVPTALCGHILVARALRAQHKAQTADGPGVETGSVTPGHGVA